MILNDVILINPFSKTLPVSFQGGGRALSFWKRPLPSTMPAKLPPEGIYGVKGFRLFLQFVTNLNLVEELHFKEKPALSLSQGFDWGGLIYQFRLH